MKLFLSIMLAAAAGVEAAAHYPLPKTPSATEGEREEVAYLDEVAYRDENRDNGRNRDGKPIRDWDSREDWHGHRDAYLRGESEAYYYETHDPNLDNDQQWQKERAGSR